MQMVRSTTSALCLMLCMFMPQGAWAAKAGNREIVVTGPTTDKADPPSAWRRAETKHVVVYADTGDDDVRRVARNLERLHQLLARIYSQGQTTGDTAKIQVVLFDSGAKLKELGLRNLRSEEGPYTKAFADQRYYDPREQGEVLAIARLDQAVDLNTPKARDVDCEAAYENGVDCMDKRRPYHLPVKRSWEAVLYSAFAQHYVLTYAPAAYPRWYLDGVGALFSTIEVRKDGGLDYALPPLDYKLVFRSYGPVKAADVVTGKYLADRSLRMDWTPYHAWAMAHYFLYSNLKPDRQAQFARYMAAVREGKSLTEAATAFPDLGQLQREVLSHANRDITYAHGAKPTVVEEEPAIDTLTQSDAAGLEARLRLGTLTAPPLAAGSIAPDATVSAPWIAPLRQRLATAPLNAEASLALAEAECRSGQSEDCLAHADAVLAKSPDNVHALGWKGVAQMDLALAAPATERAQRLAEARKTISRAIQIDADEPLPLIAYFQSFTKAGEPVPAGAMFGMASVTQYVPAAPSPRLELGAELVKQGKPELAHKVLDPVLYGAYDSPEKTMAGKLFASAATSSAPATP